jgi:hypothetical protein
MSTESEETTQSGRESWPTAETILVTDGFVLRYHPLTKIVHHEFRRYVHGEEFHELLEQGLILLKRHGATKWLSDDRNNGALKPVDAQWSTEEWSPRAMAAGWKYWAVVLPKKVFGQTNMRRFVEGSAEVGRIAQAFELPSAAMSWLRKQQ